MSDNEFHDAMQPAPITSISKPPRQHFFQAQHDAEAMRRAAMNMSRQQQFDNGLIDVEDLDDEELRAGKCRDQFGRIPRKDNKTDTVPRDIYDAMVEEHERRTDQKLREQLDTALETMVGIMVDDTVEPQDRFKAAQYLFERVKGKTPERIHVATGDKAPWEEVFSGVAKITRQRSMALQEGAIDAEVVPDPGPNATGVAPEDHGGEDVGEVLVGEATVPSWAQPAPAAPSHDMPVHSDPAKSNAQVIREQQAAAAELAERRKAAKDRIQGAKKRRIIKRAFGHDATLSSRMDDAMASTVHKLMSPPDG